MQVENIDFHMLRCKAKPALKSILRHYPDFVEDVLQNSFIKVLRFAPSFEGKAKLSTWFVRIAINEALMFLRTRKIILVDIENAYEVPDQKPSPQTLAEKAQVRRILTAEINKLPRARREVMKKFLRGEQPGVKGKTAMFWGRVDLRERLAGKI